MRWWLLGGVVLLVVAMWCAGCLMVPVSAQQPDELAWYRQQHGPVSLSLAAFSALPKAMQVRITRDNCWPYFRPALDVLSMHCGSQTSRHYEFALDVRSGRVVTLRADGTYWPGQD